MEDREIVALYWRRDESAISETEGKYGALCQSVARNILGRAEDAEECVNDALHQAWTSIPPQRPDKLGAWLDELAECVPGPAAVEHELEQKELAGAIDSWLRGRSREDRILFLRRYWYGVELQELAAERGMSPNRLAQKMHRLRRSLKQTLEKEGYL